MNPVSEPAGDCSEIQVTAALEVLRIGGLRGFKGWWFTGLCYFAVMQFPSFLNALHSVVFSQVFEVLMAFVLKSRQEGVGRVTVRCEPFQGQRPSNASNAASPDCEELTFETNGSS